MSELYVTISRNSERRPRGSAVPLSAEQWAAYPQDWAEISFQVKERAEWRCECHDDCGRGHEHLEPVDGRCRNRHGDPRWHGQWWQGPVILSAAHLDHDPTVRDLDRLRALCPGCHLAFDRVHHAATRQARRERALGLLPLFDLV